MNLGKPGGRFRLSSRVFPCPLMTKLPRRSTSLAIDLQGFCRPLSSHVHSETVVWDQKVAGSNPAAPTNSRHPEQTEAPPGQLRGYTPPGSGPARSRSCRLNSHSKLSGSFSITPTASPRASRAFQIDNGVESIASDDQPVVPGDGTSGRRKANPGMAPNVTASSVRQTQSIEATILISNQASYVALQPAICDGSEGGEREGTQQVQSRRIGGAG